MIMKKLPIFLAVLALLLTTISLAQLTGWSMITSSGQEIQLNNNAGRQIYDMCVLQSCSEDTLVFNGGSTYFDSSNNGGFVGLNFGIDGCQRASHTPIIQNPSISAFLDCCEIRKINGLTLPGEPCFS